MMRRSLVLIAFVLPVVYAQTNRPKGLRTWFPDGTALEIHTESTNTNSPLSSSGGVIVGRDNIVHRQFIDPRGGMLFAYDIEARKTAQGTVSMWIRPVDQEKLRDEWFPKDKPKTVFTLTAARDFPPLRPGDQVQVDVLYHPVTGEKIYDVIRVSIEPPPSLRKPQPEGEQFSLQGLRVAINGQTVHEPEDSWLTGKGAMIYLPGRGAYYFALSPPTEYPFKAAGWVDHTVLRFHAGTDLVEVFGKRNILEKSDYGTVWVYHHPTGWVQGEGVQPFYVATADNVLWIIPKKKPKEE